VLEGKNTDRNSSDVAECIIEGWSESIQPLQLISWIRMGGGPSRASRASRGPPPKPWVWRTALQNPHWTLPAHSPCPPSLAPRPCPPWPPRSPDSLSGLCSALEPR
jgi:hypothetical protein